VRWGRTTEAHGSSRGSRHKLIPVQGLEDPHAAVRAFSRAIEDTRNASGIPRAKVMGIGIGLDGIIGTRTGVCHYSPALNWHQVDLIRPLEDHVHLPVYIDNDVYTLAIAEQWFGIGHGVEHFLVVTIGRGVGMLVARAGRALGLGLSYLVNLFNPQLIMLSGEGACAGEALSGPARDTIEDKGVLPSRIRASSSCEWES
jgi:predicted NBD/HSP70 family sugar kinase